LALRIFAWNVSARIFQENQAGAAVLDPFALGSEHTLHSKFGGLDLIAMFIPLNQIKEKEKIIEGIQVPSAAWDVIQALSLHICGQRLDLDQIHLKHAVRFAPSIVIRTEAELFGVSMPRFGYRFYLPPEGNQLINCRRLAVLQKAVNHSPLQRALPDLQQKIPVADCLLGRPKRFAPIELITQDEKTIIKVKPEIGDFIVVQQSLALPYGEVIFEGGGSAPAGPEMVPYIMTVDISGGVCAQACCFMATTLKYRHARTVCGLAEISYLARTEPSKITMSGLSEQEMSRYFDQVQLRSIVQTIPLRDTRQMATALGSYLMSDIPVIATVDQRKLKDFNGGDSPQYPCPKRGIYQAYEDAFDVGFTLQPAQSYKHAVLFVGVEPHFQVFLVHDPSALPFMGLHRGHLQNLGDKAGPPHFLPVTPKAVQVPLLCEINPGRSHGLMTLSVNADEKKNGFPFALPMSGEMQLEPMGEGMTDERPKNAERRYILTTVGQLPESAVKMKMCFFYNAVELQKVKSCLERARQTLIEEFRWHHSIYVWVEFQRLGLRIFHAQLKLPFFKTEPPDSADPIWNSHVPFTATFKGQDRVFLDRPCVELSLINSFTLFGLQESLRFWPEKIENLELYAFMHEDLAAVLPPEIVDKSEGIAVRALAGAYQQSLAAREGTKTVLLNPLKYVRDRIDTFLTIHNQQPNRQKKPLVIRAFSTFIPELREETNLEAVHALSFLVELAAELRPSPREVFTIEVVCGSRIDSTSLRYGTLPDQSPQDPCISADVKDPPETVLREFLSRLEPIVDTCKCVPGIQLALELEPGPLFVLNNKERLTQLCQLLDGDFQKFSPFIGLNLDVAHWAFLAGITPDWLNAPENAAVRNRIAHAHICDHSNGHFADNVFASINREEDFDGWLQILACLPHEQRPPDYPTFDGLISIEMEACKDKAFLDETINRLERRLEFVLRDYLS
jgi:sugar phosphate isomerase/epimerase